MNNQKGSGQPPKFLLWRRAVSPVFRQLLIDQFKVNMRSDFGKFTLNFLSFLLFGSTVDEETGRIVICREAVAALAGKECDRNFKASTWINRFSREVVRLRQYPWDHKAGKCRTIDPVVWPVAVAVALEAELNGGLGQRSDLVYLDDGKPVSRRSRQRDVLSFREYLDQFRDANAYRDHPAAELLDYLNQKSVRVALALWRQNAEAVSVAISEMASDPKVSSGEFNWARQRFEVIESAYDIAYKPTDSTDRVYVVGHSPDQLPKRLRQIAYAGAIELDIRNSQLAIAAAKWKIPQLAAYLRLHKSIWPDLLDHMRLPKDDYHKQALKDAIYSILFQMLKKDVEQNMIYALLCISTAYTVVFATTATNRFMTYPIIADLLKARSQEAGRIRVAGGARDAFGVWHTTTRDNPVRKIMARVMQSIELKIMMSVLPIFKGYDRLHLISWLHDGITFVCGDKRDEEGTIRRLSRAIEDAGKAEGVDLTVQSEKLTAPGDPQGPDEENEGKSKPATDEVRSPVDGCDTDLILDRGELPDKDKSVNRAVDTVINDELVMSTEPSPAREGMANGSWKPEPLPIREVFSPTGTSMEIEHGIPSEFACARDLLDLDEVDFPTTLHIPPTQSETFVIDAWLSRLHPDVYEVIASHFRCREELDLLERWCKYGPSNWQPSLSEEAVSRSVNIPRIPDGPYIERKYIEVEEDAE